MLVNYEKQTTTYTTYTSLPLTARPLDFFYFIFFLASFFLYNSYFHELTLFLQQSHIPATLLFDLQALFRAPGYLRVPVEWYLGMSHDPFVGVLSGVFGDSSHRVHLGWFKCFLLIELCVHSYFTSPLHLHYH